MADPQLFLCGVATARRTPKTFRDGADLYPIDVGPNPGQIHLDLNAITRPLQSHLLPVYQDLLDVAAYVYVAP